MTRTKRWTVGAGLIGVLLMVLALPTVATASEVLSIPFERAFRGEPGSVVRVATAQVPAELVGQSCEMVGETTNQRSVHPGNDLIIQVGDQTQVLLNFEDEADIRHEFRQIQQIPPVIELFVRFGPDGVTSGGFLVSIECADEPPPTTTTAAVTTTSSSVGSSTTAPSTAPTTTLIAGPTVSPSVPTTTLAVLAGPPKLAVTGTSTAGPAALGLALITAGALVLVGGARARRMSA